MKKLMYLFFAGCLCLGTPAEAQILKRLKKGVENAAERAVISKTEQKVSRETGKAMDSILDPNTGRRTGDTGDAGTTTAQQEPATANNVAIGSKEKATTWTRYNFVPGDEIIFEDDLTREENGEFPSRWDLVKGNAENAALDGENIINIENRSIITPLMNKEDYLPEEFTVEFDAFFNDTYSHWQEYVVRFYTGHDTHRQVNDKLVVYPLHLNKNGASIQTRVNSETRFFEKKGIQEPDGYTGWKHIAISYNRRTMKVFIDEERVLNIPNIELVPTSISIEASDSQQGHIRAIKNIRIAEGGKKLYDRIMAEGKFITRGILFDVNKASLKNESMGVINEIATMMKEHPEMRFSIEGHTDSDGEDNHNLQLSEQRAIAVKDALAGLGIDAARMQTKGLGETVPVSDNTSPEGKANNRRVEFIKI